MSSPSTIVQPDLARLADGVAALADRDPAPLRAWREAAWRQVLELPPPAPNEEAWRRIDPRRFAIEGQTPVPPPERTSPGEPDALDEVFDAVIEISGDGWLVRDRSGAIAAGQLEVLPLADAATRHAAEMETLWNLAPAGLSPERHEWAALAACQVGMFIRVADGMRLDRGVLVRLRDPGRGLFCPATMIAVGAGASLHLAQWIGSGAGEGLSIETVRYRVAEGGRLRLARVQQAASEVVRMEFVHGALGRDASLDAVSVQLGAEAIRSRFGVDAAGRGASARIGGLAFAAGRRQWDQRTVQIHSSPDTTSDLLFKTAVRDRAHSVYRGLIAARRGAVRIAAYQRNHNLVLNDGARADSLPGLLIDADDLTCTHGATVGNIDPDQVFYLRSRGLSEATARRLLLEGFFEEITSRLALPPMREALRARLAADLDAPPAG